MEEKEMLEMDFEAGEVRRGDKVLMSIEEFTFLIGSAVAYNNTFPIPQTQDFVNEVRELVGEGFTREQYADFKKEMAKYMNNENE